MATEKQILANRKNALTSTGPKMDAGKSIVAGNALKLGVYALRPVVPGLENAEDWEEFRSSIVADLAPVGAFEVVLAERIAGCLWRMRRVTEAEAAMIDSHREDDEQNVLATGPDIMKMWVAEQQTCMEAVATADRIRNALARWQQAMAFFAKFEKAHDSEPVNAEELFAAGSILAEQLGDVTLCLHEDFLSAVQPPTEPKDTDAWERPGWTVAHVRRVRGEFEQIYDRPSVGFMQETLDAFREALSSAEAKEQELLTDLRQRRQRALGKRSIPDDPSAAKIARYESHLSRQMSQAIHELERRQASRKGATVTPPQMLDVTVHGMESPSLNGYAKQSQ